MEHKQDLSFLKEYRKQNRTAQSYYNCGYNKGQEDLNRYREALEDIEEVYKTAIKNITTYDESNDLNITIEALHNISDIINKVKDINVPHKKDGE